MRSRAAATALTFLLAMPAVAQQPGQIAVTEYHRQRDRELAEAGQRHLQLGSWARKQGLVPQATGQFLRAVEVSQGRNPGANTVLMYMRGLGDAFWPRERKRPPRALLAEFSDRSAIVERKTRKAHVELAQRATRAKLVDASKEHWLTVLRLGGELDFDDKAQWRLDGARIPAELAEWLQQQTTKVNGDKFAFEVAGKKAPALVDAVEVTSEQLIVRTDLGRDRAGTLHALGTALWPLLQERLDGTPLRPLRLFVFGKRADYESYLDARDLGIHKAGRGLCDYGAFQTLVCAEGLADDDLHALTLHELSHLFFFGAAPAVMPDWYAEGFAESFGGQGTFTWDGKVLTVGGSMRKDRIAAMQQAPFPLRDLLAGDPARLLATAPDRAMVWYAQCWALHRYLLDEKSPWHARFLHYENKCRGQVLGAPQGGVTPMGSAHLAIGEFERLFGQDLDALEQAFKSWLAGL